MKWRLKNTRPCPPSYREFSYGEVTEVINGECTVKRVETRDFLLKQSYVVVEEIADDHPGAGRPEDSSPKVSGQSGAVDECHEPDCQGI